MPRLILASQSPRRQELLAALGIPFEVIPSRADESLPPGLDLSVALERVALRKARQVAQAQSGPCWVLGADTAVVLGGAVLGKPSDRAEARRMLQTLSGRSHRVLTAVALLGPGADASLCVETDVDFGRLTAEQIEWYTALDEPYDKAGAYAIQGRSACFVAAIRGSYTNVVGLPMAETAALLHRVGLTPWGPGETSDG